MIRGVFSSCLPFGILLLLLGSCRLIEDDSQEKPQNLLRPTSHTYVYDSSLTDKENFHKGFIDTFSVNGTRFRYYCALEQDKELIMEVFKDGKWEENFYSFFGVMGVQHTVDVNADGFNDFQFFSYVDCNAYMYNDSLKRFEKYPVTLSVHNYQLNPQENSFYELWWNDSNRLSSDVYVYKNLLEARYLYRADEQPAAEDGKKRFRVYSCRDGKRKDTVYLKTVYPDSSVSLVHFDRFWKQILTELPPVQNPK